MLGESISLREEFKFNENLMIQNPLFFYYMYREPMKGPPGKSFINRMYKFDRAGGGMAPDDFQKLPHRPVKMFHLILQQNRSSPFKGNGKTNNQPLRAPYCYSRSIALR